MKKLALLLVVAAACGKGKDKDKAPAPPPAAAIDVAAINAAYDSGATDFLAKPVQWALLPHRARYVLRHAEDPRTDDASHDEHRRIEETQHGRKLRAAAGGRAVSVFFGRR